MADDDSVPAAGAGAADDSGHATQPGVPAGADAGAVPDAGARVGSGHEYPSRPVTRLSDPRALRAVAHPLRLSLIAALRREGPLTATQAGRLLGESSASCSFHLRQLAKWDLVEEAGGGQGRERPWRATTMFTSWPDVAESPEAAAASTQLSSVIAERYFDMLRHWLQAKPGEPEEWQRAAHFGDTFLHLSAEELRTLGEQIRALLDPFVDRALHPELRPADSRTVAFLHLAFPANFALPRTQPPGS